MKQTLSSLKYSLPLFAVILFFFQRGGFALTRDYNPNLAYVFDQLGLAFIALIAFFRLTKKGKVTGKKKFSKSVMIIITALVMLAHFNSFFRPAIFDEWFNVIQSVNHIKTDKVDPEQTGFLEVAQRYAWGPYVLIGELTDYTHPLAWLWISVLGNIFVILAALSAAWLSWHMFKNNIAALLAGFFVGISPNSFTSLPWPSSVLGDSLGVILTCFTVATWVIGREKKQKSWILLSLLFFAASLKGGGSVRTITSGSLLIMTDLVLYRQQFTKKWLVDWIWVLLISIAFYLSNNSVQMQPRTEAVAPLTVKIAQIMELTSKTFIPPTAFARLMIKLEQIKSDVLWVAVLGAGIFVLGSLLALAGLVKKRLRLFTWGWAWFYSTIFYVPWFAEGYGSTMESINDREVLNLLENAGFKYSYLPLVALHIVIGIFIAALISKKKWQRLGIALAVLLVTFRVIEFVSLDYRWRTEIGDINRTWQSSLFSLIPPDSIADDQESVLIFIDGKNNPIMGSWFSVQEGIYNGNLKLYSDVSEAYAYMQKTNIHVDNVYALVWDSGKLQLFDSSGTFRSWLQDPESVAWTTSEFENWTSNITAKEDYYLSDTIEFGDKAFEREPQITSPLLVIPTVRSDHIGIIFDFSAKGDLSKLTTSPFKVALVCNSDHGRTDRSKLIGSQKTLEDQLSESIVPLIPVSSRLMQAAAVTKCDGGIITRVVITGPTGISFKPEKLKIFFPGP